MGVVYKARQIRLNRVVALKVLHPSAVEGRRLDRFRHEAVVASGAPRDKVVQVYDLIEHVGRPVIVMEFIEGCDLGLILKERRARSRG